MNKPLVSVIVAAYNVEAYISECLDSILEQDYDNFELICVEDVSTDNTASILEVYQNKDKRIHIIKHHQNSGLSAVRNTGLDFAKGKYVLFVDGDDFISSNLLSETVSCAEKNELDEVSFGYKFFTNEKDWSWKVHESGETDGLADSILTGRQMLVMREKMLKKTNGTVASLVTWSWLYNRTFLERNRLRFLRGVVHEDVLFWFQCCLQSKRVMIIGKQFYFYRRRTGSITTGWNETRSKSLFAVFSLIYADWIKSNFTEEENEAISALLRGEVGLLRKSELCGETKDMKINPAIDFCYKLLHGQLPYKFGHLAPEAFELLDKASNVLVYGAGNAAADVFEQLYRNHIKVSGVIVSQRKDNPAFFGGVPVKTLQEWGFIKDTAVVLAVTGKYSSGIESKLRLCGYQQILYVEEK